MKLSSNTFQHEGYIPERCAFGIKDTENRMALGENKNPHLSWSEAPDNTKSLVLICVDTDVPSSMENFNKEGKTISKDLPRLNFYH
ncbi:MAG: phospholipid-binding protein, partial [Pseudomonadota bacterium]|nr:phospholipid-binding protein [Pseudomonadota bacterium]